MADSEDTNTKPSKKHFISGNIPVIIFSLILVLFTATLFYINHQAKVSENQKQAVIDEYIKPIEEILTTEGIKDATIEMSGTGDLINGTLNFNLYIFSNEYDHLPLPNKYETYLKIYNYEQENNIIGENEINIENRIYSDSLIHAYAFWCCKNNNYLWKDGEIILTVSKSIENSKTAVGEKEISNWSDINLWLECLGASIEKLEALYEKERDEAAYRMGTVSLEYYGDNKQCVYEYDKGYGAMYFFGKPVFEKGSYCSAVVLLGYDVFPEGAKDEITKNDLEGYFGKQYKYYAPDKGLPGHYIYNYKDIKVVFYENNNSTISKNDYSVLITDKNQKIDLNEVLSTLRLEIKDIAITASNIGKYEEINKYFDLIHKSADAISKEEGILKNIKADSLDSEKKNLMIDDREEEPKEFYVDSNGAYYEFIEGDRTSCLCIWLPFKLVSDTFKEKNYTMEEFANYFNDANFAWISMDEVGYLLKFENNHGIYIPTYNNDGNPFTIDTNQYIYLD